MDIYNIKREVFYEEEEECHQILHMAQEILKGRRKGIARELTRHTFESYIKSSLNNWLLIHFHSRFHHMFVFVFVHIGNGS